MTNVLANWLSRFGICTVVGVIAGSFAGMLFGSLLTVAPQHHIPTSYAFVFGLILGVLAWLAILWLLGVMGDYDIGAVALPVLVNCLITSILTALSVNLLHLPSLAMLLGWVIGFFVGRSLCLTCGTSALGANRGH